MKINIVFAERFGLFRARFGAPRGLRWAAVPTRFDRDTEPRPVGEGAYAVRIARAWWVVRGPNGGYVAALLVRALEHAIGDAARPLRSPSVRTRASRSTSCSPTRASSRC